MNKDKKFKEIIREARISKNISVADLSRQMGYFSTGMINEMEGRGRIPSSRSISKLSKILSLDFKELIDIALIEKKEKVMKNLDRWYNFALKNDQ